MSPTQNPSPEGGMATEVELLSQALLREYMHKKGYKATWARYDDEEPRTAQTISSRKQMASLLGLTTEQSAGKYKTFMEMIVEARLQTYASQQTAGEHLATEQASTTEKEKKLKKKAKTAEGTTGKKKKAAKTEPVSPLAVDDTEEPPLAVQATPPAAAPAPALDPVRKGTVRAVPEKSSWGLSDLSLSASDDEAPADGHWRKDAAAAQAPAASNGPAPATDLVESLVEDLDGETEVKKSQAQSPAASHVAAPMVSGTALGTEVGRQIKRMLFGDRPWRTSWVQQGFFWSSEVSYGLVQREGGPCGPLAVVQAYLLKDLLFDAPGTGAVDVPTPRLEEALASALAAILWTIATHGPWPKSPTVFLATVPGGQPPTGANFKQSCSLEDFRVLSFTSEKAVRAYILANSLQFTAEKGNGLLLFLTSTFLTKVGSVRNPDWTLLTREMDSPQQSFIVEHGYSSQELVNLLIHGHAVSNVFDGTTELSGGEGPGMALKGVAERAKIGYLSLHEHYDYLRVGENLKSPHLPLWVVCSESHFTVLFAKQRQAIQGVKFDLHYYDQLGMQDEEIRLTVDTSGQMTPSVQDGDELTPPIDQVIRTKWKGATINWNDTDPLL
mmetsp:Transcript_11903/g.21598  ORF Transcript_11903/g.21598 Transcript_11903/m.21598 type:complete len:613 (-) Transcript_11903:1318-3156(-)